VKLHRNAKTTPHMRALLVDRIRHQRWTPHTAASAAGISVRSAYKWLARHHAGGVMALEDRPSTPHRQPRRTAPVVTARIIALRYERRTAWAIAVQLHVPRSTVAAVLARAGMNQLARLTPPAPVVRYEWPRPGDLLHLDIKRLARIAGVGHRIHGDRAQRARGVGWEYVHVAVDDHSRIAFVEVLADQLGATCAAFLARAVAWLQQRGITVRRVLSDNGSGYVSRAFRTTCQQLGLRHLRTRAYTPRTNGKAERFIQTLLREWAYIEPYASSRMRRLKLRPYLQYYNRQRPHASLDYQAPSSRLTSAA